MPGPGSSAPFLEVVAYSSAGALLVRSEFASVGEAYRERDWFAGFPGVGFVVVEWLQ